jgi:hypothetical protein
MAHWCSHSWDPGASKMVLGSNSNWSVGELLLGPVPMSLTCGCLKGLSGCALKEKKLLLVVGLFNLPSFKLVLKIIGMHLTTTQYS